MNMIELHPKGDFGKYSTRSTNEHVHFQNGSTWLIQGLGIHRHRYPQSP